MNQTVICESSSDPWCGRCIDNVGIVAVYSHTFTISKFLLFIAS